MESFVQFSAKTKSDAITKACIELETSSDQLEIEVISEGSSGFFGIGSKPAVIKVRRKVQAVSDPVEEDMKGILDNVRKDTINKDISPSKNKTSKPVKASKPAEKSKNVKADAPKEEVPPVKQNPDEVKEKPVKEAKPENEKRQKEKPVKEEKGRSEKAKEEKAKEKAVKEIKEKPAQPKEKPSKPIQIITDEEEIKEIEQRAVVFLKDVFASMDLGEVDITSTYNRTDGSLEVDFEGDDMGMLIGKRGQTLDSLQYLTSLVVNKDKENYIRVKLDTEDYRRRRKETLESLARSIANKVKKYRKPVVLEAMNPYERRIIHSALQNNKYVETVSEGEEPYRHIVVKLKRYERPERYEKN